MSKFNIGEVWFARFPYEEQPGAYSDRPVVVLDDNNTIGILSVKVTSKGVREYDPYDTPIVYWDKAGLRVASTARVSKTMILEESRFQFKIGSLQQADLDAIKESYMKFVQEN